MVFVPSDQTTLPESRKRYTVLFIVFALFAAGRVFIFSAAFPFFNNVDEEAHFDLVVKYSRGHIPHGLELYSPESAHTIAFFRSPEFLLDSHDFQDGRIPPPFWRQPLQKLKDFLAADTAEWQSLTNHESQSVPLYYAVAGLWLKLGRSFGLQPGVTLYWIRFLNVGVVLALAAIALAAGRALYPTRPLLQLSFPLLVSFFPQDIFYSIQSDVFSPLCFGGAFVLLIYFLREEHPNTGLAISLGVMLAASYLSKASNLPLVIVAILAVGAKSFHSFHSQKIPPSSFIPLILVIFFTAAPIAAWMTWSNFISGDPTGSVAKIKLLGWMRNSLGDSLRHPLFTFQGLFTFWSELFASFWRGELKWFGQELALPAADRFYWISSSLFCGLAAFAAFRGNIPECPQRKILFVALGCVATAFLFLALLSISFDYGNCLFPSRKHPYFTTGRLISGILIPFCALYIAGLDFALARWSSDWLRLGTLITFGIFITASEIILGGPIFGSAYNWFHL